MLAAISSASKCKGRLNAFNLCNECYKSFSNSSKHVFACQPFVKEIWGFTFLPRTRNLHYIDCIRNNPSSVCWIRPLEDLLRNLGTSRSLATKISSSVATPTPDEILNQILAAIDDPSVSIEETCISYIKELCINGNLADAIGLIQGLRGKNILVGSRAYDHLLQSAGEKNDIHLLSEIFKDLVVSCGDIRLTSYLVVAGAFAKSDDSSMLQNFVEEICEMELSRKDIVLNRVIFALGKCGHVEKALVVFNHMKSLKCKPDLVTYNTILMFLGKIGRVHEMLQEFNFMKTVSVFPDVITYNTVVNSLRKMGQLDLCLAYFKEMSERGHQPDGYSFKALVESLGRSGNIQEALKALDEMKCRGMYPSVHIYRALVFSLRKMGMVSLAAKFSREMNGLFKKLPINFSCKNK